MTLPEYSDRYVNENILFAHYSSTHGNRLISFALTRILTLVWICCACNRCHWVMSEWSEGRLGFFLVGLWFALQVQSSLQWKQILDDDMHIVWDVELFCSEILLDTSKVLTSSSIRFVIKEESESLPTFGAALSIVMQSTFIFHALSICPGVSHFTTQSSSSNTYWILLASSSNDIQMSWLESAEMSLLCIQINDFLWNSF